jgi:hypothetical protein
MRSANDGTVTTIQLTGKRYKGVQAAGVLVMCVGVVGIVVGGHLWGSLATLGGLATYIAARIAAWWAHG